MATPARGPGIRFPPPFVFVAGYALAWLLDRRLEFKIDGAGPGVPQQILGLAALAGGLGVMGWGLVTFIRARTPVNPMRPARQLVTWGPFRFSRNPMYVGLTLAYFGLALVVNQAWPLILLPLVLITISLAVIGREERYLRAQFGAQYDAYAGRVRRWL
jgi:protein-S-isoprenylcysteine O-methyltransferase Ste14